MPSSLSLHVDPRMAAYGFMRGSAPGGRHHLTADRFAAFFKEFLARGLDREVEIIAASPKASHSELTLFHTPAYVDFVRTRCETGSGMLDAGSVPAERGMDIAAAAVAGTVLHAARRVMNGDTRRAFVPIAGFRQARPGEARDGCIYNDAAILIQHLKRTLPGARVAYVDLDAHFSAGVFEAFESDAEVALLDLHQDSATFWSASNAAPEPGAIRTETAWSEVLNAGSGDEAFLALWPEMRRWLQDFRPNITVLVAGANSLRDDGLAGLAFTPAVHERAARDLAALAERFGQGRMLVLGGGGYALNNLGPCWSAVIAALLGTMAPDAGVSVVPAPVS